MIILSITTGTHNSSAVVADDYEILSAIEAERVSRVKGQGGLKYLQATINEALRVAGKMHDDVDVVAVARNMFWRHHYYWNAYKTLKSNLQNRIGKPKHIWLINRYVELGDTDHRKIFKSREFINSLGLSDKVVFFDYNHHLAHALSALFYTKHQDVLIYTADGGGDTVCYSTRHLKNGKLHTLYGGEEELNTPFPVDSVGLAYGYMTQALGYKMNRHEGKLTGLASYGKPTIYADIKRHFTVCDTGRIGSNFESNTAMREGIENIARNEKPEDAACSIQKALEELVCKSIAIYLKRTGAECIALAGGVFANVSLNRRIGDMHGVKSVFIFPGMGDEGLSVGGLYAYLLHRDGLTAWLSNRRELNNVYWGGAFDNEISKVFNCKGIKRIGESANKVAKLIADGRIVALYTGRMEFGPRALGARSILANPADNNINETLNARLTRTEFMPFAPMVLQEDANDVFEVDDVNSYAMRFMTITCNVRKEWQSAIPAVVHIDGTARPQIICESDSPFYAKILREFKNLTGLPVLINTSFNAHEEPIIYTPHECLHALKNERVDCIATQHGIYEKVK